jgi:hypothetical protein
MKFRSGILTSALALDFLAAHLVQRRTAAAEPGRNGI